tara:strand:- start:182 stop:1999 length:1818 start_codon:yes stop_codon:yes gene_type:complete
MEVDALLRANNPSLGTLDDFEEWLAPKVAEYKNQQNKSGAKKTVYNIPVIIHIIHNSNESIGQERNISNAQAISQIDVLNEDFRKQNGDFSSTPAVFQNVAADCEINFCLATVDTSGNTLSEAGINRISAPSIGASNTISTNSADGYSMAYFDGNIKPNTQWNPDKYLNVWVAHMGPTGNGGQLLGYAQFPNSSGLSGSLANKPANTDGVVMLYKAFGNTGNLLPSFPLGRTATHEVGHWLGLRHIWGDANCGDDYCSDTPTQQGANSGCPTHPNLTCSNSGDMFVNFMDYCDDACLTMFTQDQKARMVTVMQNSPRRGILNSSNVCNGGFSCSEEQNFSNTDTPSLYPNPNGWGWISGHNSFDDRAKAEKFIQNVDSELRSVEIAFSKAYDGSGSGTINVNIWSESGGLPATILESKTVLISTLTIGTSNTPTITFDTPVQLTAPVTYFVGVEFSANTNNSLQDTIAIYSNADGESSVSTAFEQWFDGTWHDMGDANAWNKQFSFILSPEVCVSTVGVEENRLNTDVFEVYPNPTSGNFSIDLNSMEEGFVEVYNLLGKKVLSKKLEGNKYKVDLNIRNQPNGVYLIRLNTAKGISSKKVLLNK